MYPEQILAALTEAYATCPSYRDSGHVVTRFLRPDGSLTSTSVRPFRTAFVRPDRFRFEFLDRYRDDGEWDRFIVWADGPEVRTWWDSYPGREQHESLGMAMAGATGKSRGSAHTIPALIMPEQVGGRRLTELVEVQSLGDEPLAGVTCYRPSGRFVPYPIDPQEEESLRQRSLQLIGRRLDRAGSSPVTVWIDRGAFLVRRIEEQERFETFRTETVTEYDPAIGAAVPEDELRFGAPDEGSA